MVKTRRTTETEWLACEDLERMLMWFQDACNSRKLLLFGCACCRRFQKLTLGASPISRRKRGSQRPGESLAFVDEPGGKAVGYVFRAGGSSPTCSLRKNRSIWRASQKPEAGRRAQLPMDVTHARRTRL
jgi:hypothetical protein